MSEDEMVEFLAELQRRCREIIRTGSVNPYDERVHKSAVNNAYEKLRELAELGDIV